MARRLGLSVLAFTLVACSSEVVQQAASTSGGTGGADPSTSTTSGGGSGGAAGGTPCVPEPEGSGGFAGQPTCADLSVLTVSDLVITGDGGDGKLSPGEGAKVTAKLNEVGGKGFNWYPGVIFTTDHPGVSVSAQDWFYAIFACQSMDVAATITVGSDVAPGTVVSLRAQVAMLNTDCPGAYAISVPIEIE